MDDCDHFQSVELYRQRAEELEQVGDVALQKNYFCFFFNNCCRRADDVRKEER